MRDKLFFGTFIRYFLLSSMKLQITFGSGLAIGYLIEPSPQYPEKDSTFKSYALAILIVIWLVPPVSGLVLRNNKDILNHSAVKKKIGAYYDNLNADKELVWTYPVVFLVRRCLFVLTTYLLYTQPGLQIQAILILTDAMN